MDNLILLRQYLYRWFHGQPVTPEQVEAFYGFLEWKPQHDEILRGIICLPTGRHISVPYSEDEALTAANAFSHPGESMDKWRERYQTEYADLDEAALWDKFNWHYLNFLIKRRPDAAPCYAAQYTRPDGTEREFSAPDPDPERKDFVPTGRAFLLEAGWEWQAVMMLLTKVSERVLDEEKAFELFVRIAEQADFKPEKHARTGAFIRDRLRCVPGVNKTKLGQAVGLSYDQVLRLEDKDAAVLPAEEIHKATRALEALILQLKKEAATLS